MEKGAIKDDEKAIMACEEKQIFLTESLSQAQNPASITKAKITGSTQMVIVAMIPHFKRVLGCDASSVVFKAAQT